VNYRIRLIHTLIQSTTRTVIAKARVEIKSLLLLDPGRLVANRSSTTLSASFTRHFGISGKKETGSGLRDVDDFKYDTKDLRGQRQESDFAYGFHYGRFSVTGTRGTTPIP
jgi:hypothetical protein